MEKATNPTYNYRRSQFHLALALAALICWGFALWLPLTQVKKLGLSNTGYLISIGDSFRQNDQLLLGIMADLLVVAMPSILFLLLPWISNWRSKSAYQANQAIVIRLFALAKSWAMPEVFILSILVAFIKLGSLAETSVSSGFYFLLIATLILTFLLQVPGMPALRTRKSRQTSWSLLLAATLLLIPANILPIMTVRSLGGTSHSTIIGGVSDLAGHGYWGIAAIVFTASILVPFGKLGGLAWLLMRKTNAKTDARANKTHHYLHLIGRWSMLDIFLIGTLASLIDFGVIASIHPGPAAPAFAASVILTVLALERYEP